MIRDLDRHPKLAMALQQCLLEGRTKRAIVEVLASSQSALNSWPDVTRDAADHVHPVILPRPLVKAIAPRRSVFVCGVAAGHQRPSYRGIMPLLAPAVFRHLVSAARRSAAYTRG